MVDVLKTAAGGGRVVVAVVVGPVEDSPTGAGVLGGAAPPSSKTGAAYGSGQRRSRNGSGSDGTGRRRFCYGCRCAGWCGSPVYGDGCSPVFGGGCSVGSGIAGNFDGRIHDEVSVVKVTR